MLEALVSLLLFSVSSLDSMLYVEIIHISAPVISVNDSGMIGGSPRNDTRMANNFNWLGPYSWYCVSVSADVST